LRAQQHLMLLLHIMLHIHGNLEDLLDAIQPGIVAVGSAHMD
jgi:hypothetical protein